MKAVIVSGGQPLSASRARVILSGIDYVVCADKGAKYAADYGIIPDLVVGDMDSVDEVSLSGIDKSKILVSPKEKDYTDTHLAVVKALEKGADQITIICATGLRSDHTIANIRLLLFIESKGAVGKIIDDENIISLCTGKLEFDNKVGTTVSLIALSDKVKGITLSGFKYPLNNCNADLSWTTGISNEIIAEKAIITVTSGNLLIFEIHNN
ncbi:MAG: thiamine diphosphokinase [Clostridiales bacterium]|nr:thiamine diphosphokinase [Clostridiales bacterium]